MSFFIDFVIHIDKHIINIVNFFGDWTYFILFSIIFLETGAVILPFLPGDSLLFAASAISANPDYNLNIWIFILIFLIASIGGDSLNFKFGSVLGKKIESGNSILNKIIKPKQLKAAEEFFNRYGNFAIFIARFVPIMRTFVPFIAASSHYDYKRFAKYNIPSCLIWVFLFCGAGYFFGNIKFVQDNFSIVVLGILFISLVPIIFEVIKNKIKKK
ncbi:VTT domain-containing protein [Apilactobacillus xinyiensis]|uniref:VTT domain-containing protein n=1 Tax=Apilactobacillus xinyiensis TaxID=2841032 RepID=A0ABT0I1Q2_9LACO|nr:VTT domain-containing protein [Apilactobacillus xinyiensis]MCK8624644.1 VTT domain-containing protein [Apilactobacillus xinyiensis]MCL0318761.1 VTT domain-containing protein [Apilactobacillus xinyiensis]